MNTTTKMIAFGILIILLIAGGLYYRNGEKTPTKEETGTEETAQATTTASGTENVPVTIVQNTTISVTEADNGKTITVKKGTRVVVALGEDIWTLNLDPAGIINRIKNIAAIRGVQGIYTADTAGMTRLTGEGRPNCTPGEMCAQYIKNFEATIVVTK